MFAQQAYYTAKDRITRKRKGQLRHPCPRMWDITDSFTWTWQPTVNLRLGPGMAAPECSIVARQLCCLRSKHSIAPFYTSVARATTIPLTDRPSISSLSDWL